MSGVRRGLALALPVTVWVVLVVLLVVAAVTPGNFGDPAAPYRLVAYPLLALLLPALWRTTRPGRPLPVVATTLVMAPFLVDTVSNIARLYSRVDWWDDLTHAGNWLLLCGGIGLALVDVVRPDWALVLLVVGLGALLALAWEVGEWAFFYDPPYAETLYRDTVADQVLGTAGALLAGLLVAARQGAVRRGRVAAPGPGLEPFQKSGEGGST